MDSRHAVTILPNCWRKKRKSKWEWDKEERRIDLLIPLIDKGRNDSVDMAFLLYLNGLVTGALLTYIIFL